MKTTKKGFTLIELIVVIAIIGVLAAILVPAMLGYVKKAKINAANSDCKTLITTYNAAIEEMDEEGEKCDDGVYGNGTLAGSGASAKLDSYLGYYSDAALSGKYAVIVFHGSAVAAISRNGKYFGTYPAFLTNKNYDKTITTNDAKTVCSELVKHYNDQHPEAKISIDLPTGKLSTKDAQGTVKAG